MAPKGVCMRRAGERQSALGCMGVEPPPTMGTAWAGLGAVPASKQRSMLSATAISAGSAAAAATWSWRRLAYTVSSAQPCCASAAERGARHPS